MTRPSAHQITERLQQLSPEIPWAHHFQLAEGVETVTPADEKFYHKSISHAKLAQVCKDLVPLHTRHGEIRDLSVLDIACGEGCHSIELARDGAKVCGIEGRPLYVARAQFVAEVLDVSASTNFVLDDVRTLSSDRIGRFDLVLAFGILHHLNQEAFIDFLRSVHDVALDTVMIYCHIATDLSVKRHRLKGPVMANGKYEGYLFQEHDEHASKQERLDQVRASLDNTYSFWPTEQSLIAGLSDVGFSGVFRSLRPHLFQNYDNASYRPILICRR